MMKRSKVVVDSSDSESSDDELPIPPAARLGPETIRVCTGLTALQRRHERGGGIEISGKRERVEQLGRNGDGMLEENNGLEGKEMKRNKLDVFDFNEYDVMSAEIMRMRHFDNNDVDFGGRRRFMGGMHAARSGIHTEFESGSSRNIVNKRNYSYNDRASGLYLGDSVDHGRLKMNSDGAKRPAPLLRGKLNSDESVKIQGENGVLKVMVNKKKVGKLLEHSDHHKYVESRHSLRTERTSKRNAHICPSSHLETKPVEKHCLLARPNKKQKAARKQLSSMDSKGGERNSDNSDISPCLGIKNSEVRKSSKKIISEDEQSPKHEKLPTTKTKEVKVKCGSVTEKQKLREQIREMLLNSGWTIDYRPRRNRDYLDAVYIHPGGTAYWSIIKAYDALQKQLNDDDHEAKPKGETSSFAPIANDVLSQLTRNTQKKMEKDLKKKERDDKKRRDVSESDSGEELHIKRSSGRKHCKNDMDSDSNEEKLSSFLKQGNKSMKTRMTENAVTRHSSGLTEKSLSGSEPHLLRDRKSRRHGRCTLLVRNSNKGTNSEFGDFVPYTGKRTVLSWLIDSGVVQLSQKVQYCKRKRVLLEGWITRDGIHCICCSKILTVSKFELHAGSKLRQPYQNIFLNSGVSLLQCQIDAWNRQENYEKISFHSVDIDGDDPNDDTCGICGDGGDLICCDGCPSTFHLNCLDIQMLPPGEWHCLNCTCKFCGIASVTINKEDDAAAYALHTCALCKKKYHNSCTKEVDAIHTNSNMSGPYFCGKDCKELFEHLKKYLSTKYELDAGFTWSLIHRTDEDSEATSRGVTQRVECNSKLAVALTVMDECFLPIIDRRSGINLIHNVLYNSGSNFNRLNYNGFYTAILERGDEIISAASIRFHGTKLVEMPFIGTRHIYRHQGMCRRLFSAIELAICSLKVEMLVIPAISELIQTWITVFGFTHLEESLRQEMKSLNMLVFPGIDMLQKLLMQEGKLDGNTTTADAVLATGAKRKVFNKLKMAGRLDVDFPALHNPRGSDAASSNPTNEINSECSAASQELNNQVLVARTVCSKYCSEERLSDDSVSDKCVSSSTSHGVLEMDNKIAAGSHVDDKLHFSPKCQISSQNEKSVTGPPLDSTDCHEIPFLGQETACSSPGSTKNLVEPISDRKCQMAADINCDSFELGINPLLESRVAENALSSKEVDMNNAFDEVLEACPSVNLSQEKITKENNENIDVSDSVLGHAGESFLQVRSDLNCETAQEGKKNLHLGTEVASNKIHVDETGLNAPSHSFETDPIYENFQG
ncbi:putative histone acetyltransferase chromatin regulator PHD family [Lupinus albus]|uniref:Putative histone acetyltransferase chromatin regulator PHD family n=1 Tax=Lupinus albus TaxID=3870 RepID=A0A6A4NR03_LUPAL|nr:putative histone acetyltransferase chromatin regulator PHD family [Lupinus albus]